MTSDGKLPILSLRDIKKSYGPIQVLHGIDLDVYAGEVVALLGENGAGKSTVSNVISGTVRPSSGLMRWQGAPFAPASPREALEAGVGMIHQELLLLPHLSIAENIFVGRYPTKAGIVDRKAMEERAEIGLQRLGLDVSPRRLVAGLSTANQQLIEIAKVLTLNARLLILDEPTAALGGDETTKLFEQIAQLKADGVGIIYISHRLEEIKRIADRIVVMRDGEKVQEFASADVPVRSIVEAMVGRSLDRMFPAIPMPQPETVLEVKDLSSALGSFSGINFKVQKGEIFGIAGLVGAVLGGLGAKYLGRERAIIVFGLSQVFAVGLYAIPAMGVGGDLSLYAAIVADNLLGGAATVALFTAMMDVCRPLTEATDYTIQACVIVILVGVSSAFSGYFVAELGYRDHFLLTAGLTFVAWLAVIGLLASGAFKRLRVAPPTHVEEVFS